MFQVLSVAEVRSQYFGVVKALYDGVHVARVAEILEAREAWALRGKEMPL